MLGVAAEFMMPSTNSKVREFVGLQFVCCEREGRQGGSYMNIYVLNACHLTHNLVWRGEGGGEKTDPGSFGGVMGTAQCCTLLT